MCILSKKKEKNKSGNPTKEAKATMTSRPQEIKGNI